MVRVIEELLNKTITSIDFIDKKQIIFYCDNDEVYMMEHLQDCCEEVWLEDVDGDLGNFLNSPIVLAEEVCEKGQCENRGVEGGTYTWTFYKFATAKGYITMRWYGESNGFYSEKVSIYKIDNHDILKLKIEK